MGIATPKYQIVADELYFIKLPKQPGLIKLLYRRLFCKHTEKYSVFSTEIPFHINKTKINTHSASVCSKCHKILSRER